MEIQDIKLQAGYLLVDTYKNEEIRDKFINLIIDDKWETTPMSAEHTEQCGKIVKLCDKIKFTHKNDWSIDIDVEIGDDVWFDFRVSKQNRQEVDISGKKYLLVPYTACTIAMRGDKIIPLNGYLVFTPERIVNNSKYSKRWLNGIVLFDKITPQEEDEQKVYIVWSGKGVDFYYDFTTGNKKKDVDYNFKEGMKLLITKFNLIPIESSMHARLPYESNLYRIQRKDIIGIYHDGDDINLELVGKFVMIKLDKEQEKVVKIYNESYNTRPIRTGTVAKVATIANEYDSLIVGDRILLQSDVNNKGEGTGAYWKDYEFEYKGDKYIITREYLIEAIINDCDVQIK